MSRTYVRVPASALVPLRRAVEDAVRRKTRRVLPRGILCRWRRS